MANELTTQAAAQIAQQQEMAASSKKQRWQQAELSAKDVRAEKHTHNSVTTDLGQNNSVTTSQG
jgi:hypothetical protein